MRPCRPTTVRSVEHRIFGLESEFGVTFSYRGQRRLSPDEVARHLFRRVVHWGRSSQRLLGERLAPLPRRRAATPSTRRRSATSSRTSSPRTRRGSGSSRGSSRAPRRRLHEDGIKGEVFLFKNNTDSAGNSYGCHENYLSVRDDERARLNEVMIPFLVSRQIYSGAGKVLHTAKGPTYCVSQRAEHIWESVSSATTRSRPIINTRDEPHADAERFRRLHVIVGDTNMSEYATYLKVGATCLMLAMIEDPSTVLRDLTLENPIRAIREISQDPTCRRKVRARQRPGDQRARDPVRVPRPCHALRRPARAAAGPQAGPRDVAALRRRRSSATRCRSTARSTGS